MSDHNKLSDNSNDKKYFTLTPQIVWAYCRSVYDFTLWHVVKMIAGDNGECFLSTNDLATLSMMSVGKVHQSRQYLLNIGLLKGEKRKDPGFPQEVWHLRIPDLWPENIKWRQEFDSLKDRIQFKEDQKNSFHLVKPSPGEKGSPPGEKGSPPGETKKNQKENQKKNPTGGPKNLDYLDHVIAHETGEETVAEPDDFQKHFGYRDEVLKAYNDIVGSIPNQGRKDALIQVSQDPRFAPDSFRQFLTEYNNAGGFPYDIDKMVQAYWLYLKGKSIRDAMYPDKATGDDDYTDPLAATRVYDDDRYQQIDAMIKSRNKT